MNWLTKKTKRKITFIWLDGTSDYMVVSHALLGRTISMLYDDNRIELIQVENVHYCDYIKKHGGLVVPVAVADYEALKEMIRRSGGQND